MQLKVYIVILNYNGYLDTIECLESIFELEYSNFHVIVCDNDSTNNSVEHIKEWGEKFYCKKLGTRIAVHEYCWSNEASFANSCDTNNVLTIIRTGSNLGYAHGNNIGMKFALEQGDADFFWILNNDTVVDKLALAHLVDKMNNNNNIGICGSSLIYYWDKQTVQALGGSKYNTFIGTMNSIGVGTIFIEKKIEEEVIEAQIDCIVGASMLVSKNFLLNIGYMEENLFLYFEEIDWATRAKGLYKLGYSKKSIVYHKEGRSTGGGNLTNRKRERSCLSDYYGIRNRIYITKKFFRYALPTIYLSVIISMYLRVIRGQFDRATMIFNILKKEIWVK